MCNNNCNCSRKTLITCCNSIDKSCHFSCAIFLTCMQLILEIIHKSSRLINTGWDPSTLSGNQRQHCSITTVTVLNKIAWVSKYTKRVFLKMDCNPIYHIKWRWRADQSLMLNGKEMIICTFHEIMHTGLFTLTPYWKFKKFFWLIFTFWFKVLKYLSLRQIRGLNIKFWLTTIVKLWIRS